MQINSHILLYIQFMWNNMSFNYVTKWKLKNVFQVFDYVCRKINPFLILYNGMGGGWMECLTIMMMTFPSLEEYHVIFFSFP